MPKSNAANVGYLNLSPGALPSRPTYLIGLSKQYTYGLTGVYFSAIPSTPFQRSIAGSYQRAP